MTEPMDYWQMKPFIGREGSIPFNAFKIRIKVKSVRSSGKSMVEYLITPLAGSGEAWLSASMVELDPDPGEALPGNQVHP